MCYDPKDVSFRCQLGRLMDHINTTKGFAFEHLYYLKAEPCGTSSPLPCLLVPLTTPNQIQVMKIAVSFMKLLIVVDETDRLLREAYQSYLPTVLKLTQSNDNNIFQAADSFFPYSAGALRTRRRCLLLQMNIQGNSSKCQKKHCRWFCLKS